MSPDMLSTSIVCLLLVTVLCQNDNYIFFWISTQCIMSQFIVLNFIFLHCRNYTRNACKSGDDKLLSCSPNIQVGYHAGKHTESVVYCLIKPAGVLLQNLNALDGVWRKTGQLDTRNLKLHFPLFSLPIYSSLQVVLYLSSWIIMIVFLLLKA